MRITIYPVSSATGEGLKELVHETAKRLEGLTVDIT